MTRPGWSAADLHIHTTVSDGVASPLEVLKWVNRRTDLAVIAIADHDSVRGALEAADAAPSFGSVAVIVAQEVESADGHIIGLWAPERVDAAMSAADTVAAIHDQGGIALAAHPFAPLWWHRHGLCRGDADVYDSVDFDAIEVANSTPLLATGNWRARWYQMRNRHRLAATGGSDAHILSVIGTSRTLFRGSTPEDLRRAIEARETRVRGPEIQPTRGIRYVRHVPRIKELRRAYEARFGMPPSDEDPEDDEGYDED